MIRSGCETIRQNLAEVASKREQTRGVARAAEKLNITPEQQATIKLLSDRAGEQVGQLVSSLLADILTIIMSGNLNHTAQGSIVAVSNNSSEPTIKKLLNAGEVAKELRISKTAAYQLMQRCEIATVRFGRSVRVRPDDLEKFINHNAER